MLSLRLFLREAGVVKAGFIWESEGELYGSLSPAEALPFDDLGLAMRFGLGVVGDIIDEAEL